jgi:hypothetical protein
MGGSSGGVIVQHAVHKILTDPLVHGRLPITTQTAIDPILAKECAEWDVADRQTLANAITWALTNLP